VEDYGICQGVDLVLLDYIEVAEVLVAMILPEVVNERTLVVVTQCSRQ
jgi:hypothetical protein